ADELAGRAGLLGPRRGDRRERNCGDCLSSIHVRPSYNSSWRGHSCPPRPQSCRRVFESRTKTSAGTIAGAADGIAGATALLQKLRAQLPILLQHSKISRLRPALLRGGDSLQSRNVAPHRDVANRKAVPRAFFRARSLVQHVSVRQALERAAP